MGKIESIEFNRAQIALENIRIGLFLKYKGVYCSKIKIYKLGCLISLLSKKGIYFEADGDAAKFLQGWFYQDDLINALARKIEACANETDLINVCQDLKNILAKK